MGSPGMTCNKCLPEITIYPFNDERNIYLSTYLDAFVELLHQMLLA